MLGLTPIEIRTCEAILEAVARDATPEEVEAVESMRAVGRVHVYYALRDGERVRHAHLTESGLEAFRLARTLVFTQ